MRAAERLFGRRRRALAGRAGQHHPSLAAELPYLHCGEFQGFGPLHLLADDALGYAFTLFPPTVDTVPNAEDDVAQGILAMLHALPAGSHWQWFARSEPQVDAALRRYRGQPGIDACGRLFTDRIVDRWQRACGEGFFPDDRAINLVPRQRILAVAIKSEPLGLARPGLRALLRRPFAPSPDDPHDGQHAAAPPTGAQRRAARFVAGIRDVLAAAQAQGWEPAALDAQGLVDWVGAQLFPQRGAADRPAGDHAVADDANRGLDSCGEELRAAIGALGRIEGIDGPGFRSVARGAVMHHRVVSMLWPPRAVASGMLDALAVALPRITVCVAATPIPPVRALAQIKARALLNARSTHRFNETEMQARTEALHDVEHRIFADGERIFETRLQIHISEDRAEAADDAAARVCKILEQADIESAPESDIGSSLLLRGCLPFTVYPLTERALRRRRRMLSRDCADIHPAGGCWTGIAAEDAVSDRDRAPIVLYSSPSGEPLFLDPTKAEKNPHALIVGQSGSGKSFFVHDYLLQLWRLPDIRLFLVSIKADYRKLAMLLGRYVELTLDSDISLNPFHGRPTLENQARWFAALMLMITEGGPQEAISREEEVALQTAAMTAAQRNWDALRDVPVRETVLDDVCAELERIGPLGRGLAQRLHPYRKGPYRKLFNAPRGIRADDRFVFFNLGGILRQPCAALVSFCVFGIVDEVMADPALRAVPKGLVADEVWALVRNDHAAAILERSLKAYRSLGGFAIPIVQDPQDLDTPSGRVMLVNTATKIVLPMDRAGHNDLQRYVRLNERELEIVRNLRLVKRRYSEFFVSIDGMRAAKGLLIPDPLRYAVSTTDPVDEDRIERMVRECGDMLAALQRFAHEFPYGIARTADPGPSS